MKTVQWILVFVLGVALSVFLSEQLRLRNATPAAQTGTASSGETAYERVMRTQTLRCGYGTWEPGVYKDPKTGQMAGLYVELIEAMGRMSGLKIEWGPETDWGQINESLKTGKIDAFCAGMANDAMRGKSLAYSHPLSYWTFDVLVRFSDARFPCGTGRNKDIDKEGFSTAYTEGDVLETIAKTEFPHVKGIPLPPLGTPADNLMMVLTKKTDFVVFPKVMYQSYEKANPGKLRFIKMEPPLRAYGNVIAVGMDDWRMQQLVNAGVDELTHSGAYDEIMAKYDKLYPGAFLKVAPGYVTK